MNPNTPIIGKYTHLDIDSMLNDLIYSSKTVETEMKYAKTGFTYKFLNSITARRAKRGPNFIYTEAEAHTILGLFNDHILSKSNLHARKP